MGNNQLLCSEDLYPLSLERFHKVADRLNLDPSIREKLGVVKREVTVNFPVKRMMASSKSLPDFVFSTISPGDLPREGFDTIRRFASRKSVHWPCS